VAHKKIELILLRQCASHLAMPIWLMGPDDDLLFYNGPAEPILGCRFDEAGEMPGEVLSTTFQTTAEDGSRLETEDLPINIALRERREGLRRRADAAVGRGRAPQPGRPDR